MTQGTGIKMFLTSADQSGLRALGLSQKEVDQLKPIDGQRILSLSKEIREGYDRGWFYVPLKDGQKMPPMKGWQRLRLSVDEAIAFVRQGHNMGLLTGDASMVVVVDLDPGADIQLPDTVRASTPRGGEHYLYAYPAGGGDLKNWVGQLGDNVDIRTTGGQSVAVGSVMPSGAGYQWVAGHSPSEMALVPCPVELLASLYKQHQQRKAEEKALKEPAPEAPFPRLATSTVSGTTAHSTAYASAALTRECQSVQQAVNGTRNATLNTAAFNIGQLVGGGILMEAEAFSALRDAAAVHVGVADCTDSDNVATIRSGLAAGIQKPRTAPEPKKEQFPSAYSRTPQFCTSQPAPAPITATATGTPPATQEAGGGEYILIPGSHVDDAGQYTERGNDEFADEVLSRLPPDSIYRRSSVVGVMDGEPGHRYFRELTNDDMRLLVDRNMKLGRWVKVKTDDGLRPQLTFRNCSRDHGGLIIASALSHPSVRELNLITHYPIYLHGFRRAVAGYNVGGIFYDPDISIADVQPETDRETITAILDDLVTDFPFKTLADEYNFYGLLLTPIVRPALGGNTPMHMLLAPLERTGKSKLAEQVFGRVILGEPTPAIQLTGNEDEREKRVLSILLMGNTAVHLDNLSEFLDSPTLASLLTASVFQGRQLGGNRMLSLPNNLTVIGSGNNVKSTGEIAKRTVPICLQPLSDSPQNRKDFKHHDLEAYVTGARRRVLGALLGMVENWRSNRTPDGPVRLGGFERWAGVIGGIMQVNGFNDWMTNLREWAEGADPHGADLRAFVEAWSHQYASGSVTATELVMLAVNTGLFPDCLVSQTEKGRQISFSKRVLSRHVDTPVGRHVMRRKGSGNNAHYFLEELKFKDVA